MDINWIAVIVVSIIAFGLAPLWFGTFFGKIWMKIHGWEHMSPDELKKQEQGMGKLLVLEAVNTFIMVSVLAFFISLMNTVSPFVIALLIWLGFLYPQTVSAVIWGADKKEFRLTKICILGGFNLIVTFLSTYILYFWS